VKGFVKIVRPLHNLMRKKLRWKWGIRQEKSFEAFVVATTRHKVQ